MLSKQERDTLQYHRLDDMTAKARGNMYYRIRQKLGGSVHYLADMNLALRRIAKPHVREGHTLGHLDQALKLTEEMIRVLDVSALERHGDQTDYVTRTIEHKKVLDLTKQCYITERVTRSEPATSEDRQKAEMVLDHIARLQQYMTPGDAERSPYRR